MEENTLIEKKREVTTSFLKNKKVVVKFIPKPTKEITNPNHIAYGRKLEGTYDYISPPRLRKDKMKNILSNQEKDGLEVLMKRDLSIYGDFWKSYKQGGMFPIALGKDDRVLDLSVPEDYIIYKVLLSTNLVANSTDQLRDEPRESYKYVITEEDEGDKMDAQNIDDTAAAFAFYSKYAQDKSALRFILSATGKNTHKSQTMDFLRGEIGKAIQNPKDRKTILVLSKDNNFEVKVLLQEAYVSNVIDVVSGMYYTKENEPIAGENEDPTLENAARFLSKPIGQEMRLAIEARLKNSKE